MARVNIHQGRKILTAQRAGAAKVRPLTRQVLAAARILAPVGDHRSGSGKPKPGQPLKVSLTSDIKFQTIRVSSKVGSNNRYAASVHEGSRVHIIRGKGGRMLKFRWPRGDVIMRRTRGGGFYFFRQVTHPGQRRGAKYLTRPLRILGRVHGFRVIIS